jgi:mannobiose 2-epimerase
VKLLEDEEEEKRVLQICRELAEEVHRAAFDGCSVAKECEDGDINTDRIWWVEAEAVLGFLQAYRRDGKEEYRKGAAAVWKFILDRQVDKREGSEWFEMLRADGTPCHRPMVQEWKCPYHNGRMCLEILKSDVEICNMGTSAKGEQ